MATPYTEILTGHALTAEQWDSMIAQEYLSMLWFRNLMGPSQFAPIQVKMELAKGAGDAITIGLRSQLQGGRVDGSEKGAGQEGRVAFYGQRITIEEVRHLVKFERVNMSQKRVAWDILNQGREALVEKAEIALEEDIIAALGDTASGRVRGRYLYGSLDSNWNATHATALQNIDNTDDKLTTNMIRVGKRKALIPVNATAKIRPMRVKVGMNFEEWFCFVGHPYSIRDLVDNDAAYRNAQLLLPPNTNRESPLFTGASFRGSYDGCLIYEYDRLELVSSTIQCSHNFLMGAQALAVCWGQMPKFGEDHGEFDLGHDKVYEIDEIRGVEKIVYDRNADDAGISNEDNGLIHVFAAAVAD
jgi:N4-gp56 family major capsid protein